uniref:Uncharacterized protein n=1 Tax=viral metagenome TaxID=1070528 RepID=A0A6M3KMC4_9ZZZZ
MKRKVSEDRLTDVLKDYATFQVVRALEARVARLEQFPCEDGLELMGYEPVRPAWPEGE